MERPLPIFGSGNQIVDLIYSRDLARFTVSFTRSGANGCAIDCGTGQGMTVLEVARTVNRCLGNKAGVRYLPMRRGEDPDTELVASPAALEAHIGALELTNRESAIVETLEWYAQQDRKEIESAAIFFGV